MRRRRAGRTFWRRRRRAAGTAARAAAGLRPALSARDESCGACAADRRAGFSSVLQCGPGERAVWDSADAGNVSRRSGREPHRANAAAEDYAARFCGAGILTGCVADAFSVVAEALTEHFSGPYPNM